MTNNKTIERWNLLANIYDSANQTDRHFPIDNTYLPPAGSIVLDAGCGAGAYMPLLSERSTSFFGVDISSNMAMMASQYGHIAIADICHLPFEDQLFDYIWSRVVLSHIPGWENAFFELWRVLKEGGMMVLLLANRLSFMTPFRLLLSLLGKYSLGYCRHFRRNDIQELTFLTDASVLASFAVNKKASSQKPVFYLAAYLLYACDAILQKRFNEWGGDLCLILKKHNSSKPDTV